MGTEPQTDDRIDLPTEFAEHLVMVGNIEKPPETFSAGLAMFADQLAASDQTIRPEDLYTADPTRHEVHVNDRVQYSPCVLDALSAAVMEPADPVTVRSIDPVTSRPVTFTVADETVDVSPEGAVVTFGIASTIPELESTDESVFSWVLREDSTGVEDAFCRFINGFESSSTYEQWDSETDAKSVPIPPEILVPSIREHVDLD